MQKASFRIFNLGRQVYFDGDDRCTFYSSIVHFKVHVLLSLISMELIQIKALVENVRVFDGQGYLPRRLGI